MTLMFSFFVFFAKGCDVSIGLHSVPTQQINKILWFLCYFNQDFYYIGK